jgi:hypothetical protein
MKTKESLSLVWTSESTGEDGRTERVQDEVDGLTFYSYWPHSAPAKLRENTYFAQLWDGASIVAKLTKWDEEESRILSLDVRIYEWPDPMCWLECVSSTLKYFVEQGALVAWCGGEESSPSIDVFDPVSASGSVYAAYAQSTGFICNSGLLDDYEWLTDEQLLSIKRFL